ncbi:MAG TPA: DUF1080 domain-containing protein [Bryobacterales bacterium]|nr:DUF1080 domain-containing protein [Bryobacterales bacterium]
MNRRTFLTAAAALPAALQAQSEQGEDGLTSLFDGKTLDGWTIREGPQSAFYVHEGAIVVHEGSGFPTWLRSAKQYENFDFRGEFFVKGWTNSGIYLHAPEHGRNMWTGMMINIFHQQDKEMRPESMGSIFPLVPPLKVNVRNKAEWNSFRILMDWPQLKVWTNDELVQDLDVETVPELRHRLRRGYLGFESLTYPIRFRSLRVKELPGKETWDSLYEGEEDFEKWYVSEDKPKFEPLGHILRGDGHGHIATKELYKDFVLHLYIRGSKFHNGGILFHTAGHGLSARHYEIQLHDVEGAHYPTGSLYYFKRAIYPRIEPEKWYLLQLAVQGRNVLVRINGETVLEYDKLEDTDPGHIELQAHQAGRWIEYKQIRVRRL